ncbi:hypothetical protein Kpol_1023p56 [Vanderwaltozyma polyspora DSM 70294]|uniref:Uncharacterized protein n=1 Tax=Vanderwaltozyma polyspora (strain ATCC 22028 / DSM 70294 / BCRC 21397 / CBS 2163 / NBRC 10782 / NRRL Y-8283 / UCD 57-17) TaxID=436907 RepID=A7TFS9_VANPO|nr:uncharacterized protein Kpol_1023p56 [Vanderwaltozyma polyspora DSM 70294]EDO18887.1 hypothetical protein Kpol_1023p56 [Vanderwaltozyma polyspora DSM 70294]
MSKRKFRIVNEQHDNIIPLKSKATNISKSVNRNEPSRKHQQVNCSEKHQIKKRMVLSNKPDLRYSSGNYLNFKSAADSTTYYDTKELQQQNNMEDSLTIEDFDQPPERTSTPMVSASDYSQIDDDDFSSLELDDINVYHHSNALQCTPIYQQYEDQYLMQNNSPLHNKRNYMKYKNPTSICHKQVSDKLKYIVSSDQNSGQPVITITNSPINKQSRDKGNMTTNINQVESDIESYISSGGEATYRGSTSS